MAAQETYEDGRGSLAEAATERFDTIVIGGGQAGLAMGYHLKKQGRPFVILDANERIGGSWRTRTWHSLRLFTPARVRRAAGMVVPGASAGRFPRPRRPPTTSRRTRSASSSPCAAASRVDRLVKDGDRYVASLRASGGSRPTTSSSRPGSTASRAFPTSRPSSIRASCRCTPASTASRHSCARATSSSSAPATREPTSRWR